MPLVASTGARTQMMPMPRANCPSAHHHVPTMGATRLPEVLVVGLGRQEIHFVFGRNSYDFCRVTEIVQLVEQRFQLLRR